MSKRKLNKQQTARIQKIQVAYQCSNNTAGYEDGLVISRFSCHAEIEDPAGNRIHCSIRPNIDSLVAGDTIIWQTTGEAQGVVISRYPRKTVLTRTDKREEDKPIAANISQILIVVAPKPAINWTLLDSYLAMAELLQLKVNIILNKVDLPCLSLQEELLACYKPLGYSLLFISKEELKSFLSLQQALQGHVSVFVGQSGVGKSSIIKQILPHEKIQIADISELSELGCHTTSNSRFYHLQTGGALIDSPGIRDFCLNNMSHAEIIYGFREFRALVSHCKFRNCNHRDNAGCALIAAINQELVSSRRYENLIKITMQRVENY